MPGKKGQRSKKLAVIDRKRSRALRRGLDGRTAPVKLLRVTYDALCADLGGEDTLSVQQRMLAESAAWQSARLRHLQTVAVANGEYDDAKYSAVLNSLVGLLRNLGMARIAKNARSLTEALAPGGAIK